MCTCMNIYVHFLNTKMKGNNKTLIQYSTKLHKATVFFFFFKKVCETVLGEIKRNR